MGERFTKKKAKTGNTRMLTVDETNDQETNDQIHEKKVSENLNDRTKIDELTERWETYSVEERYTIQKEIQWRKRWKASHEGLMKNREESSEEESDSTRPAPRKELPTYSRKPNMKWSMCMMAIMVLGGLAMLNGNQDNVSKTDERSVTPTMKGTIKTTCSEPMERKHPKTLRGWGVFWPQQRSKPLKNPFVAQGSVGTQSKLMNPVGMQGSVGTHSKLIRQPETDTETEFLDGQLQYAPQAVEAKRGNAYWTQQWFNYPSVELVVGMTDGKDPGKNGQSMPPEETMIPPPEEEDQDPENEERMVERMMEFARRFAESVSRGDDALEAEINKIYEHAPALAEGEEHQLVTIEPFEFDFASVCNYNVHPMNWNPPCNTSVFMMPAMLYMVHGSNGTIMEVEPEILALPMNEMRRRFLRNLLSRYFKSDCQIRGRKLTDQEAREAVNTLADEQLLREWYWMHLKLAGPDRTRSERFLRVLRECARMMAFREIMYSDEELRFLRNSVNAVESSRAENLVADDLLEAAYKRREAAAKKKEESKCH